jgi:hypothetical protein
LHAEILIPQKHPQTIRGTKKHLSFFPPTSALTAFLNKKPSSLLCVDFLTEAAGLTPKAEYYGRECYNNNYIMRDLIKYFKRKGLLIELGVAFPRCHIGCVRDNLIHHLMLALLDLMSSTFCRKKKKKKKVKT